MQLRPALVSFMCFSFLEPIIGEDQGKGLDSLERVRAYWLTTIHPLFQNKERILYEVRYSCGISDTILAVQKIIAAIRGWASG